MLEQPQVGVAAGSHSFLGLPHERFNPIGGWKRFPEYLLERTTQAASSARTGGLRNQNPGQKVVTSTTTNNQLIAERAYQLWMEQGCHHGHDVEDWLKAEAELSVQKLPLTHQTANRQLAVTLRPQQKQEETLARAA